MKAKNAKALLKALQKARPASRKRAVKEDSDYLKTVRAHWRKVDAELRKRKPIKRDLSQINFQAQHWWKEQLNKRTMTIDKEKAALIYEGYRRRPEVQRAWLECKGAIGANGWQPFVGLVALHLRQSWVELNDITRLRLLKEMQSWFFVPPRGYSTFPDKSSGRETQREASFKELRLPPLDDPALTQRFVKQARRFVDAGFIIVAVDKKKNERVRYAFEAIQGLPKTHRKQDLDVKAIGHLPADLPQAERDALERKLQDGTLTIHDISDAWLEHQPRQYWNQVKESLAGGKTLEEINAEDEAKQTLAAESSWQQLVSYQTKVIGKRPARGTQIEEKIFNLAQICRDFERIDSGRLPHCDFVQRLRLR